jgi:hypothetical protein
MKRDEQQVLVDELGCPLDRVPQDDRGVHALAV